MTLIPVLSLIVAALAVFFGPILSWKVARRQIFTNLEVSNKQIIAPMRQVWINSLRDSISELLSLALHYQVSGFEDRSDNDYLHLTHLEYKIMLMLNRREDDHQNLERLMGGMIQMLSEERSSEQDKKFAELHKSVVILSRDILKREWDRVKDKIEPL